MKPANVIQAAGRVLFVARLVVELALELGRAVLRKPEPMGGTSAVKSMRGGKAGNDGR